MMSTYLNTKSTMRGTELTFEDGRPAGLIVYLSDTGQFHHERPDGCFGIVRLSHEAAEFDALAWAADETIRLSLRKLAT